MSVYIGTQLSFSASLKISSGTSPYTSRGITKQQIKIQLKSCLWPSFAPVPWKFFYKATSRLVNLVRHPVLQWPLPSNIQWSSPTTRRGIKKNNFINDNSVCIPLFGKEGLPAGRQGYGRFFKEIIRKIPLNPPRDRACSAFPKGETWKVNFEYHVYKTGYSKFDFHKKSCQNQWLCEKFIHIRIAGQEENDRARAHSVINKSFPPVLL